MAKEKETKTETKTETKSMGVKTAYLHAAVIIAGKTETLLNNTRFQGIKMELAPTGLFATMGAEKQFIPAANIKNCVLE